MRIRFLGTGTSQGIPIIMCECAVCKSDDPKDKRLRSSVLVEVDGINLVIDTGPDFRQQILSHAIRQLDAVLLTHGHKDHIGGLDDIRPFNYFQQRPMDIYAAPHVLNMVRNDFPYAFEEEKYPGVPEMKLHAISPEIFSIGQVSIQPVKAVHYAMEVYGYRIRDFVYITDASFIEDSELAKITKAKILVINGLRKRKHYSHFNLEEALAIIQRVKPDRAYLTHISDQMGLHAEVQQELPENVYLAYDGLVLDIPDPL